MGPLSFVRSTNRRAPSTSSRYLATISSEHSLGIAMSSTAKALTSAGCVPYKLVCAGTVEGKIGRLLEQKRELAAKVVGAGEQWITELVSRA